SRCSASTTATPATSRSWTRSATTLEPSSSGTPKSTPKPPSKPSHNVAWRWQPELALPWSPRSSWKRSRSRWRRQRTRCGRRVGSRYRPSSRRHAARPTPPVLPLASRSIAKRLSLLAGRLIGDLARLVQAMAARHLLRPDCQLNAFHLEGHEVHAELVPVPGVECGVRDGLRVS